MNIGELGEETVAQWLISRGGEILHRRWRSRGGEIDSIAIERKIDGSETLLFIEVKTRDRHNWDEDGRLAITALKQAKLIHSAQLFLAKYSHLSEYPCRFDVAIVVHQPIHHDIVGTPLYIFSDPLCPVSDRADNGKRMLLVEYISGAFDLS